MTTTTTVLPRISTPLTCLADIYLKKDARSPCLRPSSVDPFAVVGQDKMRGRCLTESSKLKNSDGSFGFFPGSLVWALEYSGTAEVPLPDYGAQLRQSQRLANNRWTNCL